MRILLLNQCFYPDHVSTSQHLTDLALLLKKSGHIITVLSSCRSYDKPKERYPSQETWSDINIQRIWTPGLGKKTMFHRAVDAGVFWLSAARHLMLMPRHDVIISLTSPPLISVLGAAAAMFHRCQSMIWLMDMNPDQAVANGVLRRGSLTERVLSAALNWSFHKAACIVVLDRFMAKRLREKGIRESVIQTIPPWSHDEAIRFCADARRAFRLAHNIDDKFVVMYSGNHSPCHPLDTVLEAALRLRDNPKVHFLFVGGGSEFNKVRDFADRHDLSEVTCLPYQPIEKLSASLSSADLHLIVMGDPYVGIVHPCKIYNILTLGLPFLFIGPDPSHVHDICEQLDLPNHTRFASHGDVEAVCKHLLDASKQGTLPVEPSLQALAKKYSFEHLGARMVSTLDAIGH